MNKYDSMIACNKKASEEKVNRAVTEIRQMLTEREKVTVPKLTKRTGLSRGFFYKKRKQPKPLSFSSIPITIPSYSHIRRPMPV